MTSSVREGIGLAQEVRSAALTDRVTEWDAGAQSLERRSREVVEVHLVARPTDPTASFADQAVSAYAHLLQELSARGMGPAEIVSEKVFIRSMRLQARDLLAAREMSLRGLMREGDPRPALSLVEQPPASGERECEIQAFALRSAREAALLSSNVDGLPPGSTGRVVEAEGARHLFLSGVTAAGAEAPSFRARADRMFAIADQAVARSGFRFADDVVRTWIYLKTIDEDYADLNASRRSFFASRDVRPAPASTGIRGVVFPAGSACGLDLRAVRGPGVESIRPIHCSTMNEAPDYGSDFSRGTSVTFRHRRVVYVSGTASIDTAGEVVAPGDIRGQVERMLVNVKALLEGQGAGWHDLVSAITYLKRPEYAPTFRSVCADRGFSERIPNTLCVADICRPEWLCEMEAIAVLT